MSLSQNTTNSLKVREEINIP